MVSKRPAAYSTLNHELRKQLMAHRARVFMANPEYWLSVFKLV